MPYTDTMIQRLIDRWREVGARERSLSVDELRAEIHRCECLGDATEECGARGAEYLAARAEGMANLHQLLRRRLDERWEDLFDVIQRVTPPETPVAYRSYSRRNLATARGGMRARRRRVAKAPHKHVRVRARLHDWAGG